MKRRLLFLIASAALFFSCSDIVQNGVETQVSTDGGTYLVVGSASFASGAERSIDPDRNLFDENKLTELVLKGTREGDDEIVLAGETPLATLAALQSARIPIQTGNWSFTLTAKLNGVAFSGTADLMIVMDAVNYISFTMQAVRDCGGMNIELRFDPNDNVEKVVVMLKPSSTAKDDDAIDTKTITSFPATEDETGAPISSVAYVRAIDDEDTPLAPGSYYLSFDFYANGTVKPINPFGYVVNVARGFTTSNTQKVSLNETYTIEYKFADEDDSPAELVPGGVLVEKYSRKSDEITLPDLKRTGYIFGGWYVRTGIGGDFRTYIETIPTGSTGDMTLFAQWYEPHLFVSANGKSDNDGYTFTTPLDSITTAVEKIVSVADPNDLLDWTILIDGEVVGTTTLALQNLYAKSLTIMGANTNTGDDYTDILDGGSVFTENQGDATINDSIFSVYEYCVPVTIKNLKLTHGNSSRGYGGAFDTNGTVTLDEGTWITDNHTYYDGGAIMNTDNATLTIKAGVRITGNSARGDGGAIRNAGTLIIEGGEISGNTAGGSIIQQEGTLILKDSPNLGEGQFICLASYFPFTPYDITVDGELDENIASITIRPGSFSNYKDRVILKTKDGTALSEANISKFNLILPDDGIEWFIDTDGKLAQKAANGSGNTSNDNRVLNIAVSTTELHPNSVVKFSATDAGGNAVTEGVTYTAEILYQGKNVNELGDVNYYIVDSEAGTLTMNMSYPLPVLPDGSTYQLYVTASQAFASSVNKVTSSQTFDVTYSSEVLTPESQVALYTYDTENNAYNYYFVDSGAVATADTTGNADFDNMADNIEFDAYGNSYVFDRSSETVYTTNTAFAQNSVALDPSDNKDISGIAIDFVTNRAYGWGTNEQQFHLYYYPELIDGQTIDNEEAFSFEPSIGSEGFYVGDVSVNGGCLYLLGYPDTNHSWQIWAYDISSGLSNDSEPKFRCELDSKLPDTLSFVKFDEYNYSSPYSDMYAIDGAVYLLARQNTVKESSAWTWNSPNGSSTDLYSRGAIVKVSGADSVVVKGLTSNTIAKASITQMYLYLKNGSYSSPIYGTAADDSEYQIAMLGDSSAKENYGTSDGYKFFPNVYALPSVTETSAFAGPARIIAIKPKQLVIADDGYAFYMDANGALCFKNVNRVVTLNLDNIEDLENFVISNVQTTKASFEADISNYIRSGIAIETARSGGTYYDYQNSIHYYDGSNNRIPSTGGVSLDSVQETLYLSVKKDD